MGNAIPMMFPKEEVIYLDLTFEEASKFIVSAGTSDGSDNQSNQSN